MNKIIKYGALFSILCLFSAPCLANTKRIDIYNKSDKDLPGNTVWAKGLVSAGDGVNCKISNPDILAAKTGHYRTEVALGCCHHFVTVSGVKFFVSALEACADTLTITIENDGVYIGDRKGRHV